MGRRQRVECRFDCGKPRAECRQCPDKPQHQSAVDDILARCAKMHVAAMRFADGRAKLAHEIRRHDAVARGINIGLHTRLYFGDEEAANTEDPVLARIEHRVRVSTLIAPREGDAYRFDIRLQGDRETVFFDI